MNKINLLLREWVKKFNVSVRRALNKVIFVIEWS